MKILREWCLWTCNHILISSVFWFIMLYIFELHLFRLSHWQDLGVIEITFWASGMERVNAKYHFLILWISQCKLLPYIYICIYKYTLKVVNLLFIRSKSGYILNKEVMVFDTQGHKMLSCTFATMLSGTKCDISF